jgi:TDG/mug DNA glycosylase family protein
MPEFLPDIIGPNLSVLFCGINPGRHAASSGHHFVGRGNRFWKTLHLAGFTPSQIDPEDDGSLLHYGFGLTTLVERATASADQVGKHEFIRASAALHQKLDRYRPARIAFLGKAAYSALSGKSEVHWGLQDQRLASSMVWLLPNPSGLNRGFSLDALVEAYRVLRLSLRA